MIENTGRTEEEKETNDPFKWSQQPHGDQMEDKRGVMCPVHVMF